MKITTLVYPSASLPEIKYYAITNASGASVMLSSLGAAIVGVWVPDRDGRLADVVLGYNDPASYMADGPCAGKIPGRYANRIALGKFTLDGKEYSLAINNGPNALHGGPTGFQNRVWESRVLPEGDGVEFTYRSADGEEGYPGNLTATATYRWSENDTLRLELRAETDAPTIVNLTNHAYFNLDGEDAPTILDHELRLYASRWLPTDPTQIPTGELAPVAGTPMDFTEPKAIGRDIKADFEALKIGKGYDHCWVLDETPADGKPVKAAELTSAKSGRKLTVKTTQPGVQVYTGNWLEGCPESISHNQYHDYAGVAIECQNFPDAPNKPTFPSSVLRPGEEYKQVIEFEFSR